MGADDVEVGQGVGELLLHGQEGVQTLGDERFLDIEVIEGGAKVSDQCAGIDVGWRGGGGMFVVRVGVWVVVVVVVEVGGRHLWGRGSLIREAFRLQFGQLEMFFFWEFRGWQG